MDPHIQQSHDDILLDEIRRGFRVKELPQELQTQLLANEQPVFTHVRLTRLNPGRKRRIGELVSKAYNRDLRDDDVLSESELKKFAAKRGEWSEEDAALMATLWDEVRVLQARLLEAGTLETDWYEQFQEHATQFRAYVKEAYEAEDAERVKTILDRFDRWASYTPERLALYTERYAAEQGREKYMPDVDLLWLYDQAPHPAAGECLNAIEDVKDKLEQVLMLDAKKAAWVQLRERHARVFSESVEARRENTQAMARVYHCVERADATGKPLGLLAPTFEALWEFPNDVVEWLLWETFFFLNGRTDEEREYFAALGFQIAGRESTEVTSETPASEPSAASPAPQTSKGDLTPLLATGDASSA